VSGSHAAIYLAILLILTSSIIAVALLMGWLSATQRALDRIDATPLLAWGLYT